MGKNILESYAYLGLETYFWYIRDINKRSESFKRIKYRIGLKLLMSNSSAMLLWTFYWSPLDYYDL